MKVYALGDSHMQAIGPRLRSYFPDLEYEAFSGHSTAKADTARNFNVSDRDVIIVALGGNDFGEREYERLALVNSLRHKNPKAAFFWIGPFHSNAPDVDKRHLQQTESQREQFMGGFVRWLDSRPWSAGISHSADGTHFTGTSYSVLAEKIADTVKSNLGSAPSSKSSNTALIVAAVLTTAAAVGLWLRRRFR
jgi:lysophospholipase L1-like esterase